MSEARKAILGRMRRALGRQPVDRNHSASQDHSSDDQARRAVEARIEQSRPALIPARADLDLEARIDLFTQQAEAVQATVARISTLADLPDAVGGYLRRHNLPMRLASACDPAITGAPWDKALWEIRFGKPGEDDAVGLTTAFAGIAETGTLMLASDADHPTTLAFLPETSIIVLPSAEVYRAYEDAMRGFRQDRALPRSINLITGPSRSGDIEQTLQLGAHGPKRLLALLVDEVGPDQVQEIEGPSSDAASHQQR
ncbi:MAG: LutC/YkgG family protein [Geminicoccaceae bacterium]